MASDQLVELGRLGHVHVQRKAVITRNPARFTESMLVQNPGHKRTDGQTQTTALGSVPASGEACDPLRLLFRGLAKPRIEKARLGGPCDGAANSTVAESAER